MRWLFLLLLAANIIFFSWNWFKENSGDSSQQGPAFSSKGKSLVLLRELNPSPTPAAKPATEDKPVHAPAETTPPEEQQPADSRQVASKPAIATPAPEESAPALHSPPQPAAQERGLCYVLGPFTSSTEIQGVITRAATTSAVVERRWSSPQQKPGYWVHIPPTATGGEARNTMQRLESAGISDMQLITSGEMKHAISLGIFSTLERAQKRQMEVEKQGIDAAINEVRIRKRQYWLALRDNKGNRLPRVMLDNLIKGTREAKVERRPCTSLYE